LDDVRGLLFGGPGFEAVEQVDALQSNTDALDANTAALLGAKTLEEIDVWKEILRVHRETAPKIAEASEATAQNTEDLANSAGTPPPAGPGEQPAPGAGDTPGGAGAGEGVQEPAAVTEARERLRRAEEVLERIQADMDVAFARGDKAALAALLDQERGAIAERDAARKALDEAQAAAGVDLPRAVKDAEDTLQKWVLAAQRARAAGDKEAEARAKAEIASAKEELAAARREAALAGDTLTGDQSGVIDTFKSALETQVDATGAAQEAAQAIRDETEARRQLIEMIQSQLNGQGLQPPNAPGGGGGQPRQPTAAGADRAVVVNQTYQTTVNGAADPAFVAASVEARQRWAARSLGESGARVARSIFSGKLER
jgi:hypothetical protein